MSEQAKRSDTIAEIDRPHELMARPTAMEAAHRESPARVTPSNLLPDISREVLGPHADANWTTVFLLCAGCLAIFDLGGMAIGWAIARADGFPVAVGALAGVFIGSVAGGFVTLLLRPPHAVILLIAGGFAPLLTSIGAVSLQVLSDRRVDLRLAGAGPIRPEIGATMQSLPADNDTLLIWCMAFATIGLLASLLCAYAIVREGIRSNGRIGNSDSKISSRAARSS